MAVLAGAIPGAAALLEYDRTAVAGGEWWRLLTGHLTHLSGKHLLWDGLTFAVLAGLCERRGQGRMAVALGVSAVAISAGLWVFQPELAVYRGLSGLDMALAGLLAATELRRGSRWAGVALAGLGAKLAYELATGGVVVREFAGCGGGSAGPRGGGGGRRGDGFVGHGETAVLFSRASAPGSSYAYSCPCSIPRGGCFCSEA
ncbi:MAG: rhombosortase [Bryobacterales bacterium]